MNWKKYVVSVVAFLLVVSMIGASGVSQTLSAADADGAALLEQHCASCHGLGRTTNARKTPAGWEATVIDMANRIANRDDLEDITEADQAILIEYLAVNHGLATVTVTLADMGLEFGAIENWQASLYAEAVAGEETSGRFTDWITVTEDAVVFSLPVHVREGGEAPWDDYAYVRIRREGEDVYPTFDMVSDPFTLGESDYAVHFGIDSEYKSEPSGTLVLPWAEITVSLEDWGGEFGTPDQWETSLYTGTVPGDETGGRFTDWVAADDGSVVFQLSHEDAPWGEEIYIRVRPVDRVDDYPQFDLVGRPFTLEQGYNVETKITWQRTAVDGALYDVELSAPVSEAKGAPETTVTYTLTLSNTGAEGEWFDVTVCCDVWETEVVPESVWLAAGESETITVTVEIPDAGTLKSDGVCDTITITALGRVGRASDSVDLKTCGTIIQSIFLPLVMRSAN